MSDCPDKRRRIHEYLSFRAAVKTDAGTAAAAHTEERKGRGARYPGTIGRIGERSSSAMPFSTRRQFVGKVILQQLTNSDDPRISVLSRLKDDKAIGVTDEDTAEERGWQQPIHLYFGDIFPRCCGSYEGYLMNS